MKRIPQGFLLAFLGVDTPAKYNEFMRGIGGRPVRFQENLLRIRKEKGIRQKEISSKYGWSGSLLSIWETGRGVPSPKHLILLANALGVSVQDLIWGEG